LLLFAAGLFLPKWPDYLSFWQKTGFLSGYQGDGAGEKVMGRGGRKLITPAGRGGRTSLAACIPRQAQGLPAQ
jgi:hypothetical protein